MEDKLEILTQEQFFQRFRPEERGIRISGGDKETFIPVGREIVCDFCNALVTGNIYLLSDNYGLCEVCGKRAAADICKGGKNE